MEGALLMIWGIIVVVAIIVFLDEWNWRKERKSRDRVA